jgi:hypothetical protein
MDLFTGILSNEISVFDAKVPVPKEKIQDFFQQWTKAGKRFRCAGHEYRI